MVIKYDTEIKDEAILANIDRITNQIFKLLPNREEGLDWETPLQNLIIELAGMDRLLEDHVNLFSILCKLEDLLTLTEPDDFFMFRKIIFECLSQMNEVKKMRNGLESMRKRMEYLGTSKDDKWGSDGRIVKGKLLSFYDALNNSYQAEWIILNDTEDKINKERYRCLINSDKLKDDYDKKIISADFCLGLKEGDVFYWERTKTHWMVTLQHLEEEAYFRANIQRCDYQFEINNNKYWVYLRGPVETTIQWRQKHQLEFNDLNYSLLMYIVKNEETVNFLKRHQVVTFDNHRWKVVATDIYSNSGYMQVYLDEYFDNDLEPTQNTIDLEESKNIIDKVDPYIEGPTEVNVYDRKVSFLIKNAEAGEFVVNSNKVKIDKMDSSLCRLNILAEKGNFDIFYQVEGNIVATLTVKINSL